MHLLHIPKEEIINIEIPTGLPLVFDMRHRCLKLLEGEFSDYNFGKAAELLFTPCQIPNEEYEELDFTAGLEAMEAAEAEAAMAVVEAEAAEAVAVEAAEAEAATKSGAP